MAPGLVLPRVGHLQAVTGGSGKVAGWPGQGFVEMCYRMRTPKREGSTLVEMEG